VNPIPGNLLAEQTAVRVFEDAKNAEHVRIFKMIEGG